MPITLNHSNIGVQYSSDKSYIIETVKSDLYRRNEIVETIARNNLQTAPVTPTTFVDSSGNVYAIEAYTYSEASNTRDYTRVFTNNTTCDILIVGGGGAGGTNFSNTGYEGGGGGAGGVVYMVNKLFTAGTYNISVGNGGTTSGGNGIESSIKTNNNNIISFDGINLIANGGGGGGNGIGKNGGSGGGSQMSSSGFGSSTQGNTIWNGTAYIPGGYNGSTFGSGSDHGNTAGGGGGAGGSPIGVNNGGNGIILNITGTNDYYAGGGGAAGSGRDGVGGLGGGGNPNNNHSDTSLPTPGQNGKGGGGGGGYSSISGASAKSGGSGGSGIVIIRYLLGTIPTTNYLTNEPVVIAPAFTETIRTFLHSGGTENQTTHTITIGQNTICDILMIGGGGAGGALDAGGGGAGACIVAIGQTFTAGEYTIKVGKGGTGGLFSGGIARSPTDGFSSTIFNQFGVEIYRALGGGRGGGNEVSGDSAEYIGKNGGCGGGAGFWQGNSGRSGGTTLALNIVNNIQNIGPSVTSTYGVYGNAGGLMQQWTNANYSTANAGGGGGIGVAGSPGTASTNRSGVGGNGLNAVTINSVTYNFSNHFANGGVFGVNGYIGGGGGGGGYSNSAAKVSGGLGGGGTGDNAASNSTLLDAPTNGTPNTGSGGGGAPGNDGANGGYGGSGIVIIKFKSLVGAGILDGITHKRLNFAYNSDNLVAWYKFNGDYFDSSGNGHNLTNVGTVIQSTHIIEGQAVEFDSTDYLEFPATINPYTIWNGKGITFSCWVRFTAHETNAVLMEFQQTLSNSAGLLIGFKTTTGGNKALIIIVNTITVFNWSDWNNPLIATLNVWRHLVFCVDVAGKWDVYLDNVRINGTETANIPNITYNFRFINRTVWNSTVMWDGQMDDFRIYDRALSSADVSLLYNKTYPAPSNTYTLNFPVPTIADINNNSNIVLRGAYDIALNTRNAIVIPKTGQYIPQHTTFTNYSVERMYPPVRNFSAATTLVSGQTYGNGTYVVTYSTSLSPYEPFKCFNTSDIIGGHWGDNYTNGNYFGSVFIVSGYLGDWLKIQLPVAIKLTRFEFKQRIDNLARAPKDFKIYGSNDNITWVELVNKTDAVYNASYMYIQLTPEITNAYTYYGLVVNKLLAGLYNTTLNFDEWYIYGQEVLPSSLSIRYNLLNTILDPIGAQWTYNTSNMNVYNMGSVGVGTTNPEYHLDVSGSLNAKTLMYNGSSINSLGLSVGMIAQVQHLTYTKMELKDNTGWDAINEDLTSGFVIKITPKSSLSKMLVNLIVFIGMSTSADNAWWGIKLYRKIGTGPWTEITGCNGTETGSAAATAGTPVWISNNTGMVSYNESITNASGTYLDSPNTTSTVYYTAYWNQRLGDNPSATGQMFLNRASSQNDAFRPAPSSSWTVEEIWYG